MIYDIIIVGLGPAGASAAIYAKRAGLNVLCLESKMVGGYLNYIDKIDNYLGLYGISGPDFAYKLYESLQEMSIDIVNTEVIKIKEGATKEVVTANETYLCKNIILSTGRSPKSLGLPNEQELLGKGISHCALCDGAFYKGKKVAVIGGGNSALQEALYLSNICQEVFLIHRKENFRVSGLVVDKMNAKKNIKKIMGQNVQEIIAKENKLSAITLDNGNVINIDGLFVYIGFEPNTKFLSNLNITDEAGYIKTNEHFETSQEGIYAIGDIVQKEIYQIGTAVSDGIIAATNIIKKCNEE